MSAFRVLLYLSLGVMFLIAVSAHGSRSMINYQGVLTNLEGIPVEGIHDLTFTIYPDSTDWTALWLEEHTQIEIAGGLFNVILGRSSSLPEAIFDSDELWMGITVDEEPEMAPRMRMTSVPWSFRSAIADSAAVVGGGVDHDWLFDGDNIYSGVSGNIGIGTSQPTEKLDILGGRLALRRSADPLQWLELRNTDYRGGKVIAHCQESNKKALEIGALHDGGGGANGEAFVRIVVGPESSPTYAMVIKETGYVGIGTSAPTRKMEIVDSNRSMLRLDSGSTMGSAVELKGVASGNYPTLGRLDYVDQDATRRASIHYGRIPDWTPYGLSFDINDSPVMRITDSGLVGIGFTDPTEKLDVNGTLRCGVLKIFGGADLAEPFDVADPDPIEPGTVLKIDPASPGRLKIADRPYDRCVAGVVSGAGGVGTGVLMGHDGTEAVGAHPVALTGRVYCRVTAVNGAIEPGDLLTTSSIPGRAMKATDRERTHGAILGKAMSSLSEGEGLVLVLVALQ